MVNHVYIATGRRKSSIARVRLHTGGKGKIIVNDLPAHKYFSNLLLINVIKEPFIIVEAVDQLDVEAYVRGGGISGQAEALRHGIAVALDQVNEDYHSKLKIRKFLTRDSRVKERKKPGLKGARRAPQFSKR